MITCTALSREPGKEKPSGRAEQLCIRVSARGHGFSITELTGGEEAALPGGSSRGRTSQCAQSHRQGGETEPEPGKGALEVVWSTGGDWGGTAQGNTEKSKVG